MGSCFSKKKKHPHDTYPNRAIEVEPTNLIIPNEITTNHIKRQIKYQEFFFDKNKNQPKPLEENAILDQNICKSHNMDKLYYCIESKCKIFGCLQCFKDQNIHHELRSIANVLSVLFSSSF